MKTTTPLYVKILVNEFERRQRLNSRYSLRSFARHLDLDSGILSGVLKCKRNLTEADAIKVSAKMNYDHITRTSFLNSLKQTKGRKPQAQIFAETKNENKSWQLNAYTIIEENELTRKILEEWEYFAFLSLMDTKGFLNKVPWIAEKLGLSKSRVEQIIENLTLSNLIFEDTAGQLYKTNKHVKTTDGVYSSSIRQSHKEGLQNAMVKIDEIPIEMRSFTSMTIAFNPANMKKVKELIKEFRAQFSDLFEKGNEKEVYQLAIQFFPLTKLEDQN
jgi:uncharacterized protein (TIGR02147 family)